LQPLVALPEDVKALLVWKYRGGKARIHLPACLHLSSQNVNMGFCERPKRLARGTVAFSFSSHFYYFCTHKQKKALKTQQ